MSKSVLISIRPEGCVKIANGKKTVEVRKSRPKLETPFKCYIYCTKSPPYMVFGDEFQKTEYTTIHGYSREEADRIWGTMNGTVIGEFVCDMIIDIMISCSDQNMRGIPFPGTGLTDREIMDYIGNGKHGFGWHISDLVIYDMPKELRELEGLRNTKFGLEPVSLLRPHQSWCYVEELSGNSGQLESLQRHGRWKRSGPLLECNQCGEIYSQLGGNSGKSWNYCPNCGADMRGDGNA